MTDDDQPHLWHTMGYELAERGEGTATIAWSATPAYCFPARGGYVVQGGMVSAVLDAAMASVCWPLMDADTTFVTADLRVEFLRAARPGPLRAVGRLVRRTRRVIFCSADLLDADGTVLAASRGTQVVLPADGASGRQAPPGVL